MQDPAQDKYKSADHAHLNGLRETIGVSVKRRLLLWAVRWTLGFAAIGLITRLRPGLAWLWWAGGLLALISLAITLGLYWLARGRIDTAKTRIGEYERQARESERANPQDGDTRS